MAFVEMTRKKIFIKCSGDVRIGFYKNKKKSNYIIITIYIRKDICEKIGLKERASVFYDEDNKRKIYIKKSPDNSLGGFKLKSMGRFLRFTMHWNLFEPKDEDFHVHDVKYEIHENEKLFIDI